MKNILFLTIFIFIGIHAISAQKNKRKQKSTSLSSAELLNEKLFDAVNWRHLGPFRGGRSCTATGVPGKPNLYYMGTTGGGVWKTENGGQSWENISDGYFGGSIGAVAVSESNPNIIYVGTGEQTLRGNVSSGSGVWKSENAGKTWTFVGLKNTRHIGRIRIHPKHPEWVYIAAIGNIYKPNPERGVFVSWDGGEKWEKTLFVNDEVGAVDLIFDPNNADIMYASTWKVNRTPYDMSSGGEGSGIWKSIDQGQTWTNFSEKEGFPKGPLGIIGIAVSPQNSERIWAQVEAKEGGLYRSDDGGYKWKRINESRALRQRAWYYTRIYADPQDQEIVYVLNVNYHKSKDGGNTFKSYNSPHGDHHDLWIAPEDPNRMVIADDGGAQVSFDGGKNWSTYLNQPTAQFYRVTTDNHFPYRIYAAQQDNSTIRISHRTNGSSIQERDWEPTAGGESAHIAPDPDDPEIVYGGSYDGFLTRKDHRNDLVRGINVWPDNPMGHGVENMKYRFQWNFPIFFSPHDPNKLYTGSNHLHVTYNEGQSWETISPDLTTNDTTKMKSSGGPITQDNTSVEYYCTIFAAAESPRVKDLLWVGSDDGLVHVSKDGGKNWSNVTPNWPKWMMVNSVEPDPHNDGGCYIAGTRYKSGDFEPYLYKTNDYGSTWTKIVNGIEREHFTRVVRSDLKQQGLLYAGTENGIYYSKDDGTNWQSLQLNLPIVPITDLTLKNDDLIAATQGRSLWMIDDLGPLREASKLSNIPSLHLFAPKNAYRMPGRAGLKPPKDAGQNHPSGVTFYYYINELIKDSLSTFKIKDKEGHTIRTFSSDAKDKKDKLLIVEGANKFNWNLEYDSAEKFDGMILWWASLNGPKAIPGTYEAEVCHGDNCKNVPFEILKDPRSPSTPSDYKKQFDFISDVCNKLTEMHTAIQDIKDVRTQMKNFEERLPKDSTYQEVKDAMAKMDSTITKVEEALYQTKNRSRQDPLNFPIRLNNKLGHLNSLTAMGDYPPTSQAIELKNELTKEIDTWMLTFNEMMDRELPRLNQMIRDQQIDVLRRKEKEK